MSGPERDIDTEVPPEREIGTEVHLDQLFTADNLYTLRAAITAHADAAGLSQQTVGTLLLVAGELASNAVQYGGGTGRFTLHRAGTDLICRVRDNGPGMPDPDSAGRTPVPVSAPQGRGLWIVRQLAREVTIASGPEGTTVIAVVSAQGGPATRTGRPG